MAEAKKEADIKKLNFEKERQTTQAISDAAYSIQQNVTQKDITNTEMDANVLKEQRAREVKEASIQIEIAAEQKNIELAKRKAERKEAELLETVIKLPKQKNSVQNCRPKPKSSYDQKGRSRSRSSEAGRPSPGRTHQAGRYGSGRDHRETGYRPGRSYSPSRSWQKQKL